jgi:putative ABC transport system permease protein
MTLVVNTNAPLATVAAAIRTAIQPLTPAKPLRIRSVASQLEDRLFNERLMMLLTSVFGLLALGLAAVGLFGLLSYTVVARTRGIGVPLALGARPRRIVGMIVGNAMRMVGLGILIGLRAAWVLSRLLAGLMFG